MKRRGFEELPLPAVEETEQLFRPVPSKNLPSVDTEEEDAIQAVLSDSMSTIVGVLEGEIPPEVLDGEGDGFTAASRRSAVDVALEYRRGSDGGIDVATELREIAGLLMR